MANPFKDSEKNKHKVAPGGKKVENKENMIVEPVIEEEGLGIPMPKMAVDPKPTGSTCSFYLSDTAISKLEKLAKLNNCSKSKALDMLLNRLQ